MLFWGTRCEYSVSTLEVSADLRAHSLAGEMRKTSHSEKMFGGLFFPGFWDFEYILIPMNETCVVLEHL